MDSDANLLRDDGTGGLRIGKSRVFLEIVLGAYQDGATAETIADEYPAITADEARAVIAHFLKHKNEVEAYIARRKKRGEETWKMIEAGQKDLTELRARLRKCRADREAAGDR